MFLTFLFVCFVLSAMNKKLFKMDDYKIGNLDTGHTFIVCFICMFEHVSSADTEWNIQVK